MNGLPAETAPLTICCLPYAEDHLSQDAAELSKSQKKKAKKKNAAARKQQASQGKPEAFVLGDCCCVFGANDWHVSHDYHCLHRRGRHRQHA